MGRIFAGALVLVLGGGVAAVLVPPETDCRGPQSPRDTAELQMQMLETALDMYYGAHKRLPFCLEALTATCKEEPEPYLERIPRDPWGNAFEYRPGERGRFSLHSRGRDGRAGTDDDLVWPEPR